MKRITPLSVKVQDHAVRKLVSTVSNLIWLEIEREIPISSILDNFNIRLDVDLAKSSINMHIGENTYKVNVTTNRGAEVDIETALISYLAEKLNVNVPCGVTTSYAFVVKYTDYIVKNYVDTNKC
jgi:hypothetical protein